MRAARPGLLAQDFTDSPLVVGILIGSFGLLIPAITTATLRLLLIAPLAAFGGGTLMTLPYALLMPHMPAGSHGALTGFYSLSRGVVRDAS